MNSLALSLRTVPESLRFAADEIVRFYPARFAPDGLPVDIAFVPDLAPNACRVEADAASVRIAAGGATGALRALGRVMGAALSGGIESFAEAPFAATFGIMPDCSRNAVPNVDTLRRLVLKTSLMGLNAMMLYVEDTFPVEGEPYFGYLRGGYTPDDLRAADDYAAAFGVELFPCIEALGHMEQFLKWPAAAKYRDTDRVLCALSDDTYDLLDRCLASVASCFRSRRVNLGMDEAWGLGTGEFRKRFGERPAGEIMNEHLRRVREICARHGLHPMIWSDMYFRIGSKTHSYYDPDWSLDPEVAARIPRDVQLCYWDYYHIDRRDYERFIGFHKSLGSDIVFAGGAWTWGRLWNSLAYSERLADAAIPACRANGVRDIFITLWGDDGAECDVETALPAIQHAAELVYAPSGRLSRRLRAANFLGSCDGRYADWQAADAVNTNEWFHDRSGGPSNAEKDFLWEDPALAILDPQCPDDPAINAFYARLATRLLRASRFSRESAYLAFQARVARALSLKLGLRNALRDAVLAGDRNRVAELVRTRLRPLGREVALAWRLRRDRWMAANSPFGWEVVEARFAQQCARIDTLADRLLAWTRGELASVPEIETPLLPIQAPGDDPRCVTLSGYHNIKNPGCIK